MSWRSQVTPWSIRASPKQGRLERIGAVPLPSHQRGRAGEGPWGGCEDVSPPLPCPAPRQAATMSLHIYSNSRKQTQSGKLGRRGGAFHCTDPLSICLSLGDLFLELTYRSQLAVRCTCLQLVSLTPSPPSSPESHLDVYSEPTQVPACFGRAISNANVISALGGWKQTKQLCVCSAVCSEVLLREPQLGELCLDDLDKDRGTNSHLNGRLLVSAQRESELIVLNSLSGCLCVLGHLCTRPLFSLVAPPMCFNSHSQVLFWASRRWREQVMSGDPSHR